MNRKLVIFGIGDAAELAHYYFSEDSEYEVVGFAVDAQYLPENGEFCALPVIAFDKVVDIFPPQEHAIFVALGYSRLNEVRKEKYLAAKSLGYKLASYVSSRASILNGGAIGENCFILEDNTVQPFVTIGNNVTLWSGNHLGHHSSIGDHCFIASHVVISGRVTVGQSCFIGVNATIRDQISIGEKCIVGAGVLLLRDAEAGGAYIGAETPRSKVPSSRLRNI